MISRIFGIILIVSIAFLVTGCQRSGINDDIDGSPGELVGTLDGYEFYRESITCAAVIGNITVDGYDFGFFWAACGNTLDSIGYNIKKDGGSLNLQGLVDEGKLKTKDIYNKIYIHDPYKKGDL